MHYDLNMSEILNLKTQKADHARWSALVLPKLLYSMSSHAVVSATLD